MPTSNVAGKPEALKWLQAYQFRRVLDVGAGVGTWGALLKKHFSGIHVTGVEIWAPYISEYSLEDIYDTVLNEDIRQFSWDSSYDLVVFGDVLEHMSREESVTLFSEAVTRASLTLVSVPVVRSLQGAVHGNEFETHVDQWTDQQILRDLGDPAHRFVEKPLGVYLYTRRSAS